jgi:hypothetical protein
MLGREKWEDKMRDDELNGEFIQVCSTSYIYISTLSFVYRVIDLYPNHDVAALSLSLSITFQITLFFISYELSYMCWLQSPFHSCRIRAPP